MSLFIILLVFLAITAGMAWYLLAQDHGEKEPIGVLWLAMGFGVVGGVAAGVLEAFLLPLSSLQPGAPAGTMMLAFLGVGIIEEACKFLPLAFFLYPKRYFNEHTDGVIYFALAGLGFGLPENILYTMAYGAKVGMGRIILTPIFHAATTGMVGYFLAKGKLGKQPLTKAGLALAGAMVLHGVYDFGLTYGNPFLIVVSLMITLSVSVGLFLFYMRATERDQATGRSVVGHNAFCRACGQPNPSHSLYCSHCGQRA